jgi:hypothetical protein
MTKPKIPIYPRPVSPLTAEPLGASPSDIYLNDSSDSHSDNDQRATKRRRIEKLGEQYLRGDGLFIMTAGLKRPLTGWVNPWSKKHGQRVTTRTAVLPQDRKEEVPETALRVPGLSKGVGSVNTSNQYIARKPSLQGEISRRRSRDGANWLKTVGDYNRYNSTVRDDSPTPWLKNKVRNPDHLMSNTKLQHCAGRTQVVLARSGLPAATLKRPSQDENLGPALTLSADTKQGSRAKKSPPIRPQSLQPKAPAALSMTHVLTTQPDPSFSEDIDARMMIHAKEDKALNFDWASKRKLVHKRPPSTHLPEFEYHPVADPPKSLVKIREKANDSHASLDALKKPRFLDFASSANRLNAPCQVETDWQADSEKKVMCVNEQCNGSAMKTADESLNLENRVETTSASARKIQQPSVSTQTSATTFTNAMPSAQVVPAVQPPFAESYGSTAGKMIEPEATPTDKKVGAHDSLSAKSTVPVTHEQHEQHEQRATALPKPTRPNPNSTHPNHADSLGHHGSRESIVPFSALKPPPAQNVITKSDTQQMLAAITPLGFSTAKKAPLNSIDKITPATATRTKPGKQKKQASFAPQPARDAISSGSSQSSIKGSLKVSKMISKETKAWESLDRLSQGSLFGKLGLDMKTSDEDGGPRQEQSLPGPSSLVLGEPHLHGAPISPRPLPLLNTMTSAGSVQQQDAQQDLRRCQEERQNLDDGQDFNLVSAMDDLGSFLGTWDAEKEAREFWSTAGSNCAKSAFKSKSSTTSSRR